MESITLLGTENITRAGHQMADAANSISQSVGYLAETLAQHRSFMEEILRIDREARDNGPKSEVR